MLIIEEKKDKARFLPILIIGDEQLSMIEKYINTASLFVLYDDEPRAAAAVCDNGRGVYEIKNIAVKPEYQRRGYGSALIDFICRRYALEMQKLILGTGAGTSVVDFYKKLGFSEYGLIKNYFSDNYDLPIIEDGILLRDMVLMERTAKNL